MPLFHEDSHLCHTLAFAELTPLVSCSVESDVTFLRRALQYTFCGGTLFGVSPNMLCHYGQRAARCYVKLRHPLNSVPTKWRSKHTVVSSIVCFKTFYADFICVNVA